MTNDELKAFAEGIMAVAAEVAEAQRFGRYKVLVDDVLAGLSNRRGARWETSIKTAMVAAAKAGHLRLARIDLSGAVDTARLERSAIRAGAAEYHAIEMR